MIGRYVVDADGQAWIVSLDGLFEPEPIPRDVEFEAAARAIDPMEAS